MGSSESPVWQAWCRNEDLRARGFRPPNGKPQGMFLPLTPDSLEDVSDTFSLSSTQSLFQGDVLPESLAVQAASRKNLGERSRAHSPLKMNLAADTRFLETEGSICPLLLKAVNEAYQRDFPRLPSKTRRQPFPATATCSPTPEPSQPSSAEGCESDTKRKRSVLEDEGSRKRSRKSGPNDCPDKKEEDRILFHIKWALTARSEKKDDVKAFRDAILPDNSPCHQLEEFTLALEEKKLAQSSAKGKKPSADTFDSLPSTKSFGNPDGLHPSEIALCKRIGVTYQVYRCQKSRIFLALAICSEFYGRKLAMDPNFKAREIGPSQAQLFGNVDANKTSIMMKAFCHWGWVKPLVIKDADSKKGLTVSDVYSALYSKRDRAELLEQVAQWEDQSVDEPNNRLARRVMGKK